jgi:hypothetical protein
MTTAARSTSSSRRSTPRDLAERAGLAEIAQLLAAHDSSSG